MWKDWVPAPLSSSFMLTALLGFVIAALWVLPMSLTWGVTFLIFFTVMFMAAILSMTNLAAGEIRKLDKKLQRRKN